MDMIKELERIEALAENKRDSVKLAKFWKMYALEMRDEKNAEIQKLQTDLQNWKYFCKKVQRQQLAEQPNVEVLVEALNGLLEHESNFASNKGDCNCNFKSRELSIKYENLRCPHQLARKALATYQSKNEKG